MASAISNSSLLGPHIANWYPLHLLAYFMIATVCFLCIILPFSCFVTFFLPHYYGIRGGTLKHWFLSFFKGISLRLMNRFLFLELTYLLLVFQPQSWWIWVVIVQLLYSIGMVNLYPILIFPFFYKYTITPLLEGKVIKRLIALTTRAQTQMCDIFMMEKANQKETERVGLDANAFLMGWGKTRRIVLTQRMLNLFPLEEIEIILGHELGHHVHHDIWKRLISRSLLLLGVLFLFNITIHSLSGSPSAVGFAGPLAPLGPYFLILPFSFFIFCFIPLIATIMYKSYARLNEYRADEFALQMTGNAAAFKNAMIRLTNYNAIPIELSPLANLFSTHPSMASRLEHANLFSSKHKVASSH
jgi:STE24 endopeptidase